MATTVNNKEHWWAATKGLLARNKHVDGKELQEDFLKYIYEHGKEMPRQQVDEAAKDLGTNREGMANIVGALVLAGELAANDTLALTEITDAAEYTAEIAGKRGGTSRERLRVADIDGKRGRKGKLLDLSGSLKGIRGAGQPENGEA